MAAYCGGLFATETLKRYNELVIPWLEELRMYAREEQGKGPTDPLQHCVDNLSLWLFGARVLLRAGGPETRACRDLKRILPGRLFCSAPVRLFDRPLNLHQLQNPHVDWLLCIAEKDDLVDADVALAPLDFVQPEVTVFPKGHAAIATSWSHPGSACPLDGRFELHGRMQRGPVRFHLDLEKGCCDPWKGH